MNSSTGISADPSVVAHLAIQQSEARQSTNEDYDLAIKVLTSGNGAIDLIPLEYHSTLIGHASRTENVANMPPRTMPALHALAKHSDGDVRLMHRAIGLAILNRFAEHRRHSQRHRDHAPLTRKDVFDALVHVLQPNNPKLSEDHEIGMDDGFRACRELLQENIAQAARAFHRELRAMYPTTFTITMAEFVRGLVERIGLWSDDGREGEESETDEGDEDDGDEDGSDDSDDQDQDGDGDEDGDEDEVDGGDGNEDEDEDVDADDNNNQYDDGSGEEQGPKDAHTPATNTTTPQSVDQVQSAGLPTQESPTRSDVRSTSLPTVRRSKPQLLQKGQDSVFDAMKKVEMNLLEQSHTTIDLEEFHGLVEQMVASSEGDLPGLPGFPQLVTSSSPTTRDAFSDPAVRPVASTPATSPAKGIANAALLPTTAFGGQFPVAEDTASHGQDLSSSPPGMMRRSSTQPFESEKLGEKFQEVDDQTEVLSQEVEVRQAPLPKSRRGDSRKRGRSHGTDGNGSGQADASLHSDKKARQTGSSAEQLKHVGRV